MKKGRWLVFGLLGLVLAAGLTGCIIVLVSPDPNQIIEMKPGDKVIFKVLGPVNTSIAGYVWTISKSETTEVVSEGKNGFEYTVNPEGEMTNRVEITCATYGYVYIYTQGGWAWRWLMNDYRTWSIRILPDTSPVWQGNYYIENSRDVELLKDYTTVTGSLIIRGNVQNLEGLDNLTSVGKNILIGGDGQTNAITSLSGLDNLTSVGGDLEIINNAALTSLSALENMTSVGGDFCIRSNPVLTSLSGLQNVTLVDGNIYIVNNATLTSLSGLQNLTSVGGDLRIGDDYWGNPALTALGMTGLQRVDGNFSISSNLLLCTSLAEELMNQVLAMEGIGGGSYINGNKECTTP